MKKILIFISVLAFILPCLTLSIYADDPPLNWYCVRNKDHKQPIADCNMRFIEDFDGYYIDHTHGDSCDEKVIYLTFDAGYRRVMVFQGGKKKIVNLDNHALSLNLNVGEGVFVIAIEE